MANRKKITSLAVDGSGDWLIVGTENHYFTVWNLPTITLTNSLPVYGIPSNCIFKGKDILTIGSEEFIYHWSINGKYNMRVSTSSTCLTGITIHPQYGVLLVCGNSRMIDVFADLHYKSFSLIFPSIH